MHNKFFIATVVAFAAAIAAAAQNQTSTTPASTASSNMTLDSIKDLYLSVWNQTVFSSEFDAYVDQYTAAGYGVYEEHVDVFTLEKQITVAETLSSGVA